jgi:salicylate hydroxylase
LNVVAFVSIRKEALGSLKESWSATGQRSEVVEHFAGFDEPVRKIISLLSQTPSKWVLNDRNPIKQWAFMNGKVVLMGDAAHAMLPHQGKRCYQATI